MRKIFRKTMAITLCGIAAVSAATVSGCGGGNVDNSTEDKVCKIQILKSGFDTDWLHAIVAEFNKTYQEEGRKAEIILEDSTLNTMNEIKRPNKNDTDLYFDSNSIDRIINVSRSVLGSKGGALLEDLTDVYNSKAIGKDGKEQGEKLFERFDDVYTQRLRYNGVMTGYDGVYGMATQGGTTGLFLNTKVLTEKGYTLDDVATTNGLLSVVDALGPKTEAEALDKNGFFPVAWAAGNAPGYWEYLFTILFGQYEGIVSYKNFFDCVPDSGTTVANGYEVYEKRGLYEAMRVCEALENADYAVPGTSSMQHIAAEARVMTGKSLLTVSGDWIYKEMEKDYGAYLNDVIHLKTPVVSALGVKLALCGTTHSVGANCENCEAKLKEIVLAVDDGKSVAEIATQTGVAEDKVTQVRDARGFYNAQMPNVCVFMPSYSNAKTTAKLFLRFMYSDDMNDVYREKTHVSLPIDRITALDASKMDAKQTAMHEIVFSSVAAPLYRYMDSPMRAKAGLGILVESSTQNYFRDLSYSHIKNADLDKTKGILDDIYKNLKADWSTKVRDAGLE